MAYLRALIPLLLAGLTACGGGDGSTFGEPPADTAAEHLVIAECDDPCPGISQERVATLGSRDDPVLLNWRSSLAAGADFIAAGDVAEPGVVPIYDYEGRHLRLLGRYGGGPGEFRGPRPMAGPDGTIWVFDLGNQRLSIIGKDGTVAREVPFFGAPRQLVAVGPDRLLVVGLVAQEPLQGPQPGPGAPPVPHPPFHLVDGDGAVIRSFGKPRSTGPAPCVAAATNWTFFATVPGRYQVEQRDSTGEVVRTFERRVEWFEPYDPDRVGTGRPALCSMRVRGDTLWTRVAVWTGDFTPGRLSLAEIDGAMDAIVEVMDLSVERVVARQRFDNPTVLFLRGTDLLHSARQDDAGYVQLDLWRARIAPSRE